MAEAGGQSASAPTSPQVTYFCYNCNREIRSVRPDFTCSTCGSGFIEEVAAGAGNPSAPGPLLFGGSNPGQGVIFPPFNIAAPSFVRSSSQPGQGNASQGQGVSFDLFDILAGAFPPGQNRQRSAGTGSGQTPTTAGTPTSTTGTAPGQRGQFQFVIDNRRGGRGAPEGGGTVTITTGPRAGNVPGDASGGAAQGGQGGPENAMEHMLHSFLNDLISGLGGQPGGGGNLNVGGVPVLGNLGDYVWGRDGLDAIVTQLMNQMEGTGPPPMAEEKVNEIPDVSITQDQVARKLQCSVCWDDFKLDEKVKQLDCEHLFHSDCILPWLKLHGTCPICRRDFTEGQPPAPSQNTGAQEANISGTFNPTNLPNSGNGGSSSGSQSNPNAAAPNPLSFLANLASSFSNQSNPFFVNNSNPNNATSSSQTGNSRQNNSTSSTNNTNTSGAQNSGSSNNPRDTGGDGGNLDHMEYDFD